MSDASVEPFRIEIPQAVLDDLRERLARTRFPDEVNDDAWSYGTDLTYLRELCAYWQDGFDWRAQEAELNRFDHFKTEIDGLSLHFIHARSKHENALPLVITHGWPGSIVEFMKIIEPLTDPTAHGGEARDAFHVVCPSIPGYGFSEAAREPGMDPRRVATMIAQLMARLGYERYAAQGGDWGSLISSLLGAVDAEHCIGIHVNLLFAAPPKDDPKDDSKTEAFSAAELAALGDAAKFRKEETGYSRIQGTKPQTLGVGLNDSPAGLAAWIAEKFRTWTDCDGEIENAITRDELLTNITLYWVTDTITSSTRLYYEASHSLTSQGNESNKHDVPFGAAIFPKELARPPRRWAEAQYNLVHWTEMPRGGHFAALEQPELLVEDVRKFFRLVR